MTWIRFSTSVKKDASKRIDTSKLLDIETIKEEGLYGIKFFFENSAGGQAIWFHDQMTRDGALKILDQVLGTVDIKHTQPQVEFEAVESNSDFEKPIVIKPPKN